MVFDDPFVLHGTIHYLLAVCTWALFWYGWGHHKGIVFPSLVAPGLVWLYIVCLLHVHSEQSLDQMNLMKWLASRDHHHRTCLQFAREDWMPPLTLSKHQPTQMDWNRERWVIRWLGAQALCSRDHIMWFGLNGDPAKKIPALWNLWSEVFI